MIRQVKIITAGIILAGFFTSGASAFDLKPINPLNNSSYNIEPNIPLFSPKHATLSKNEIKNQYTIAMDKFMQSNVRASYRDFQLIIDGITPNDYVYMKLSKEMANIGFFSLSELAMSKIQDSELSINLEQDIKDFYFPNYSLTHKDQVYLAEIYSNIMYNDQSKEAVNELVKQSTLMSESDYANYIAAFGYMKSGNTDAAKKYIDNAINKNPNNINFKILKSEILALSNNPKSGLTYFDDLTSKINIRTTIFDDEIHSSKQYLSYKSATNEYWKKYYLAYYYYDENELSKSLRVLQTAISGKKNINKEVFALTSKVYFDMKEFEKAQDFALKSIAIDPNNVNALTVLGDIALRNKNYTDAQNYYKKAAAKDCEKQAEVKLAIAYEKTNDVKKAKEIYSKILKSSSKIYQAYYRMALLEPDRKIEYLRKSVSINPEFNDGWVDLAAFEIYKENFDKALSYLNIAKYMDDSDYRYYYYYGLILKNKGLKAEADKNFEKSKALNPENTEIKEGMSI